MHLKNQADKIRYISSTTLLRLAAGRSFNHIIAYMLAWDMILLMCCAAGGLTAILCAILVLLMDSGIFAFAISSSFRAKCGWRNIRIMRKLLKQKKWIPDLRGKQLIRQNGGWEYADKDWFIRVNEDSACVLYAPELDFSVPGVHAKVKLYNDFLRKRMFAETKAFHSYRFTARNQGLISVQVDRGASLLNWIAERGGRTVLRDTEDVFADL